MEYCERGNLRDLILDAASTQTLPISRRVSLARDAAQGMEALHARDIVHRDLKTENVLITSDWNAKIADFGTARCMPFNHYMTCNIGTPYIRAPELSVVDVEGERTFQVFYDGQRADSFSFGFLLYELFSSDKLPRVRLPAMSPRDASRLEPPRHGDSEVPLEISDTSILMPGYPCVVLTLMNDCWSLLAHQRPCFEEIVRVLSKISKVRDEDWKISTPPRTPPQVPVEAQGDTNGIEDNDGSFKGHSPFKTIR